MLKYAPLFAALLCGAARAQSAADSYLVEPSVAAAEARSALQCQAKGCDGINTVYWWAPIALSDGTAVVEIAPAGAYGPDGLSAGEQSTLAPYSAIQSRLIAP